MDLTTAGTTDIFLSTSDDKGSTWSAPKSVGDSLPFLVDRFNHWLSVGPVTGDVTVSFYDTRNDTTGQRFETDTYLAKSTDGGETFTNTRVTDVSSNEHDCDGVFPAPESTTATSRGTTRVSSPMEASRTRSGPTAAGSSIHSPDAAGLS